MTVTATNRKNSFTTNGVTTNFAFTFAVTSDQQIKALVRDALGVETPYTNFTTSLNPSAEGGTLTTLDVLDDATLVIYRETPFTQQLDYVEGGRFPAESHETAIDKLTLQNQDQAEILDRALVSSISGDAPPTLEEYTAEIDAKDSATLASANNYTDQQVFDSGGWNQALSTANIKEVVPTLTDLVFGSVADMQSGKAGISYTSTPVMWLTVQGEGDKTTHYYTAAAGDVDLGGGVFAVELDKQTVFSASASPRQTVVIYGDSITNQNIEQDSYSARGYYSWANAILGNPLTLLDNQGVSSETTTQMLVRLPAVLANNAGFVFVLGGTNDLGLTILTGAQIFANLKQIYDANVANGSIVVACTITPTLTINTQAKADAYYSCNNLIRDYARNNDNIILADFAAAYPDTTTALPAPTGEGTIDGTHPSIYGAYRMGKLAAKALRQVVSSFTSTLPTSNTELDSFAPNSTLTGTTGTADNAAINIGDIADDCRLAVGAQVVYTKCSKIPRDVGDWQRVEYYSNGGTQGFISLVQESTTGWSVGDEVQFKAEVRLNNPTTIRNCQIFLNIRDGANAIIAQRVGLVELYGYAIFDDDVSELTIETTSVVIPADAVKIELQVRPMATSGVFDFGRFGLKKV